MGRASHLFGGGGRRGGSKRKTKSCIRKEGEKIGTQGRMGKRLCKSYRERELARRIEKKKYETLLFCLGTTKLSR